VLARVGAAQTNSFAWGIRLPAPAECWILTMDILPETSMSKMIFVNLPVRNL
jgi:hypothetical protein